LGVILDVVYNHLGPDGSYLKEFSASYFTDKYQNEWGEAINFDGPGNEPVREFFVHNAGYWIDEYHLDGLRLDATQQIFDSSEAHVLAAIGNRVRQAARGRSTFLVAENEPQHSRLIRGSGEGGYGLDLLWNDDFHHSAVVALTGRAEAYYSEYRGRPQEFVSAAKWGFLFQGQWCQWQKNARGTPSLKLERWRFVSFLENHDQVANSLCGLRLHQLSSPGCHRALTALLLLGPGTPMLFQGQEFSSSSPFLFFADHRPELAKLVANGRKEFLSQFPSMVDSDAKAILAPPEAEATFARCKLNWSDREKQSASCALHRDLIELRREDQVFGGAECRSVDGAVLGPDAFLLRFFGEAAQDRLLIINLGVDLHLEATPEPLLAPPEGGTWQLLWSSENARYGGSGILPFEADTDWRIPGRTAMVLTSRIRPRGKEDGENHSHNRSG
jgi:maltooligosyltrehalose trehalohydrolase